MKMKLNGIKCCIWDIDLTLYTVSPELKLKFQANIYKYISEKLEISLKEAKRQYMKEFKRKKTNTATLVSLGLDKYAIQEVVDKMIENDNFPRRDERLLVLFDNLKSFRHVIITNSTRIRTKKTLKNLGIKQNIFEKIITKEDVFNYKPDPESFLKALQLLKLKPEECVSIGDKDVSDIIPAQKVGMKTILVWGESKYADISLSTIYDVAKVLN